jgi:hypothetical protein
MASSCKKRRFRDLQSVERSIDNVRNAIPQTTRYKNRWGVRTFEDWQSWRENKAVMCESNPFCLDLQNLQNLETDLCNDGKCVYVKCVTCNMNIFCGFRVQFGGLSEI